MVTFDYLPEFERRAKVLAKKKNISIISSNHPYC